MPIFSSFWYAGEYFRKRGKREPAWYVKRASRRWKR
jgi:hypothetical protein